MKKIKICFISLNSYPLFTKSQNGYFGGSELQISLIVKELIKDFRFALSLIAGDYGQKKKIKIGNLTIYKCFRKGSHIFKETLFFLKTLRKIDADFYIERTMNPGVGVVALFCRIFRKKFVYMVAHDWDTSWLFRKYLKGINSLLFYLGLKNADLIISQTESQQAKLLKNFGLGSVITPSIIKISKSLPNYPRKFTLWVGRADEWKQPLIFLQLARSFPKEKFVMVCQKGNDLNFFNQVRQEANCCSNLDFYAFFSPRQIMKLFHQAKVFVNTSEAEGFPNTFLQAGLAKTPILSLNVNPDGFISTYHCGFFAHHSLVKLKKQLSILLKNRQLSSRMGEGIFNYIKNRHALKNLRIFKEQLHRLG